MTEMAIAPGAHRVRTTDGATALRNLSAQINGLAWQAQRGAATVAHGLQLVELLALHGHVLGRIADAERAAALAEQLVREAPEDGPARLARSRMRAHFHRFEEALADLDEAERRGADPDKADAERAAIFQATGREEQALALSRATATRTGAFAALAALAGLHAERGEIAEAERLFDESQERYRGVSPFPLASLELQRGRMWLRQGHLSSARAWFVAATGRLPAYAPAQGRLAETDAALGSVDAAVARLQAVMGSADDPEYAAQLGRLLEDAGQLEEAHAWRERAGARYDELAARFPEAFADHASEFWLTVGGDPAKSLERARFNTDVRGAPGGRDLLMRGAQASEAAGDERSRSPDGVFVG